MIVTPYAAILALIFVYITFNVGLHRVIHKVSLGSQNDDILLRKVRAQGNFVETVSVALILITIAELSGLNNDMVSLAAVSLVLGRMFHAFSLLCCEPREMLSIKGFPTFRVLGMLLTLLPILGVSIFLLVSGT